MITAKLLIRWLETLGPSANVAIDDGGLTLIEVGGKAYLEIGGEPESEPTQAHKQEARQMAARAAHGEITHAMKVRGGYRG